MKTVAKPLRDGVCGGRGGRDGMCVCGGAVVGRGVGGRGKIIQPKRN